MQTTLEALSEGYMGTQHGFVFAFGDGYELIFEPLLFDNQMYVALYKDHNLLTNKVVIKPGKA